MADDHELPADLLYRRTDPEAFDFETTAEVAEPLDLVGQDRASRAVALLQELRPALEAAFESEEYQARRQAVHDETGESQQEEFEALGEKARERGLVLIRTPMGFVFAPVKDGDVVPPDELDQIPEDEQRRLREAVEELQKELQQTLRRMPRHQRELRRYRVHVVVDIEREVELAGPIHSKGVLILSGFLGARYASDRPLALAASLVFEQSYGGVEGDSASSAELYALLSAIGEVPLRQSVAVTGSVNQHGQVQPIGGVNEKVEGFFDVCRRKGLTGEQGVLIPRANAKHLMLRSDLVEAVREGRFHVWAVSTVDEGMEILSGLAMGERDAEGRFPEGTVNRLVDDRLAALAERARVRWTFRTARGRVGAEPGPAARPRSRSAWCRCRRTRPLSSSSCAGRAAASSWSPAPARPWPSKPCRPWYPGPTAPCWR